MKQLPRLELTEDPNKKNDYIIFRHGYKTKYVTKKNRSAKKRTMKKRTMKKRKTKKGFFSIF